MLHIRKIAAANFLKNFCRKDLLFLLSSFHIATFNVKIRWPFHHSRGLKFARINFWYDTIQKPNELMKGRASEWKDLILCLSAILIKCNVGMSLLCKKMESNHSLLWRKHFSSLNCLHEEWILCYLWSLSEDSTFHQPWKYCWRTLYRRHLCPLSCNYII